MKITINDHRKIHAVQEEFSTLFPYLKLEFHGKPSKKGGSFSDKIIGHSSKTLGDCRLDHKKGTITLTPNMTVADLEAVFMDVYGLSVIIYRKSGKAWLETSRTDKWTLEQQNGLGKELSQKGANDEDQAAE
jgi:hypothetical protein